MELSDFISRLGCAILAGAVIGFERQWHQKSAGLRTNTLVALGAALYVLISIQMTDGSGDVTRIIGQIVTGVGFLGAGVIMRNGTNVHGLTTAATVWCSSAIGCLAGSGLFIETAISATIIVFLNSSLLILDNWLKKRRG
ncbi:UNVERIFIED_CONTAM: hypothetical protein GTU68_036070 [Idotea baltica]|nr:hypothetical protein [Idotea baltica]